MKIQNLNGRLMTIAVAIFSLIIVSCSGDDGAEGPAGPAGANGAANLAVDTFTVASADWSAGAEKTYSMAASNITSSVVNGGMVMVYQMGPSDTTWSALPYSYNVFLSSGGQTIVARTHIQYSYDVGNLYMTVTNDRQFNITNSASYPGTRQFKLVVVPPSSLVEGMDYEDYETVSAVYNL